MPSPRRTPALRCLAFALIASALILLDPAAALAQDGDAAPRQTNIFVHIISSVGIFWVILLPTSIWLIAMVVLLVLDLRMSAAIPAGFVEEFTDTVNKRKFKEAFDLATANPSYLGRVLSAGMARLQYGLDDAREASLNMLEAVKSDKEQKNNYTAVIATLGPLLGLVGTVFGMIEAFMELSSGENVKAARLANGISHALAVTLVGVAIAVPAIAFNTYFRNRITQVMLEVGSVADDLLTQMYHNSKKPSAAGATVTMASPVPPAAPRA